MGHRQNRTSISSLTQFHRDTGFIKNSKSPFFFMLSPFFNSILLIQLPPRFHGSLGWCPSGQSRYSSPLKRVSLYKEVGVDLPITLDQGTHVDLLTHSPLPRVSVAVTKLRLPRRTHFKPLSLSHHPAPGRVVSYGPLLVSLLRCLHVSEEVTLTDSINSQV